jgi:hypothetical protein
MEIVLLHHVKCLVQIVLKLGDIILYSKSQTIMREYLILLDFWFDLLCSFAHRKTVLTFDCLFEVIELDFKEAWETKNVETN